MAIQNTKDFQNFVLNQEISEEDTENIERIIGAFSEYIVAVNQEYAYNKTYLTSYVKEFILCQKVLKQRYEKIMKKIRAKILPLGIEKECIINIDEAWTLEKGIIKLSNTINPDMVKRKKIQIELEFVHNNGFVIAEEINNDDVEHLDKVLDVCISTFLQRRKELLKDEAQ